MKKVILLDMDGTITPTRKSIEEPMIDTLNKVIEAGFHIGIVSVSYTHLTLPTNREV